MKKCQNKSNNIFFSNSVKCIIDNNKVNIKSASS